MSHISKPVDWEIFNIPPVQPVQYYSVLQKKREFSQLIKQYDALVFKHGYLHYCGIVPKNISSSFNNRYEIVIVFFDEIPNNSFIGFRVRASKETFTYESNSLLLFLKKSKKAVFYIMNNNCIHVQCGTNAWELFYLLYDDYLRKYVLTIIGTQFFYHFVYSHCIKREIQLLELLYKGSKIIRVSKNSIYYKIHRKRKISVTDLIHMTLNMPKSKKYIISYFNSKESLFYSDFEGGDFYTSVGNKINVSKLVLKKFKTPLQNSFAFEDIPAHSDSIFCPHSKSIEPKFITYKSDRQLSSNTSMKRKFNELQNSKQDAEPGPSTSKFCKISDSSSIDTNQWEQYQNLKPFTLKCYSGIPSINNLVPNLLKNGEKSSNFVNSNSYFMNTDCNLSLTKVNEDVTKNSAPTIVETSREIVSINSFNPVKTNDIKTAEVTTENASSMNLKTLDLETHVDSVALKNSFSNQNLNESCEQHHCSDNIILDSADKHSAASLRTTKNINQGSFEKDSSFTTAAGKNINISDTAMLTANKLIQNIIDGNQEALQEKINCDLNKTRRKTSTFKSNYSDFRKKSVTNIPFAKSSLNKPSHGIKIKSNENPSKKLEAAFLPKVCENFRQDSFDALEDTSFTTAAGKAIQVSNNAMQAAHKLIQNVFDEENKPTSNKNVNLDKKICKNVNAFPEDIGCSSRKSVDETVDVDMDNTLVEKFFEDTLFDEQELESATEFSRNENSDLAIVSKTDKNLPSRKPRKSLGGRRSMRYCSAKL